MPTSSMGLVFCKLSYIQVIFLNNCKAKTQNTWKKKGSNKLPRGGRWFFVYQATVGIGPRKEQKAK